MCQRIINGTINNLPRLCIDCKFYENKFLFSHEYGKCTKIFNINLVDGTKIYNYASSIRALECKEKYFELNEKTTLMHKIVIYLCHLKNKTYF